MVSDASPVKTPTTAPKTTIKRKIEPVVKEETSRGRKKAKMEPIVQLPQVEETPVIEPAVVVESGPVEFAKEGKSRDFSRDFLVMLCNHDVFSDEIHEEDDDYFHDDDDDVNELPVEDHGSNALLSVFHLVFLLLHVICSCRL